MTGRWGGDGTSGWAVEAVTGSSIIPGHTGQVDYNDSGMIAYGERAKYVIEGMPLICTQNIQESGIVLFSHNRSPLT